jgi:hypothetical protein
MDDPTRRCENDTGNGTRLLGVPGPKRESHFFAAHPIRIHSQSTLAHEAKLHSHDFFVLHHP